MTMGRKPRRTMSQSIHDHELTASVTMQGKKRREKDERGVRFSYFITEIYLQFIQFVSDFFSFKCV